MSRLRVLFVAGLNLMRDGGTGGQSAVARTLLESGFSSTFDVVGLSSSMESLPPPPVWKRAARAGSRLGRFVNEVPGCDVALVFTSDGLSLVEKGLMCIIARAAGRGVVVRLSSGALPRQCEAHPMLKRWLRLLLASAHVVASQGPRWTAYFSQFPESSGKMREIANPIRIPAVGGDRAGGRPTVAFVGWMQRHKGVFEALEVFRRVRRAAPTARLVMAGGGADLGAVRDAVGRLGLESCVELPGWLDRCGVEELLATSHVFLLPTHYEGVPNALLEAMAAGVPVVTTPVGGIPDVVTSGEHGFLRPVGDVEGMAEDVGRLLADASLALRIAKAARARIIHTFSVDVVWPQYEAAIQEAARMANRVRS
jgi:glycosyltransferase involved in cell wall biosynthesis